MNNLFKKKKEFQFVYSKNATKDNDEGEKEEVTLNTKRPGAKKGFISGLIKSSSLANDLSSSVGKLGTELKSSVQEKLDEKVLDVKAKIKDFRGDGSSTVNKPIPLLPFCSFDLLYCTCLDSEMVLS